MKRPVAEMIYVDCGSSDDSVEQARKAGLPVLAIAPDRPSPGTARNVGWRATSTPLVLFLDGDSVIDPDFVVRAEGELDDPEVTAVWGRVREKDPARSIYQRILDVHWDRQAPRQSGPVRICLGTALVKRSGLEAVDGYRDDLIGWEESEMSWRMGARGLCVRFIDVPMTLHDADMTTWEQYCRRALRGGYAASQVLSLYAGLECPFRKKFVRHWLRGGLWTGALIAGFAGAVVGSSWVPAISASLLVGATLQGGASAIRTSDDLLTRLAFGLHSWVQDIGICMGSILYLADYLRGNEGRFIGYK